MKGSLLHSGSPNTVESRKRGADELKCHGCAIHTKNNLHTQFWSGLVREATEDDEHLVSSVAQATTCHFTTSPSPKTFLSHCGMPQRPICCIDMCSDGQCNECLCPCRRSLIFFCVSSPNDISLLALPLFLDVTVVTYLSVEPHTMFTSIGFNVVTHFQVSAEPKTSHTIIVKFNPTPCVSFSEVAGLSLFQYSLLYFRCILDDSPALFLAISTSYIVLKNILLSAFGFLGIGRVCYHALPDLRDCNSYDAGPRQEIFTPGSSCSRSYFRDFKRINPPDSVFHWNIYIVFRRRSAFQSQKTMSGIEEQVIRYVLKCSWSWTSPKSWEINLVTRK